ncbi:MAG TPA: ferrochelatase [Planctomycetota bacterium]|nr:ferrochelatase [Planctomycetota bacterium]
MAIDGVLLLGFGGPTPGCCERRRQCARTPGCEAECFVAGILGDNPARMGRVAEVAAHYHELGGTSPYNALTEAQSRALASELARRGHALPVACGFRHWRPWTIDGMRALADGGCREIALLVMAPHQSSVSWDWYLKHAAEAAEALGDRAPAITAVVEPWYAETGFIAANAARVRDAAAGWDAARFAAAELVFTAHAIPAPIAETSRYREQFAETAARIADALGHPRHRIAYQSAPSDSRVPWTGPDIVPTIREAAERGAREVVVQACGFLVDHTEVLYDLDVEARRAAAQAGIGFTRATCVHDHPAFIAALADGVERARTAVGA